MQINSWPYVILILFYLVLSVFEYKRIIGKKRIRIISAITFIFFWGFRGYIGSDWFQYLPFYQNLSNYNPLDTRIEVGFYTLCFLFKKIGFNFLDLIFFLTVLNVSLLDNFFKEKKSNISLVYASVIVFFPIAIIDTLRNFLSICLFLQALKFYETRKKTAYLFLFIAITVHSSAILFLPIFLFLNKNYFSKRKIIFFFSFGMVIYFSEIQYIKPFISFLGNLLGGRYSQLVSAYLSSDVYGVSYGIKLGILEKLFFGLIVIYNYSYITLNKVVPPYIFNSFFIFIFIYLYLNELDVFINRLTILFFYAYVTIVSSFHFLIKKRKYRFSVFSVITVLLLLKAYISFNVDIYKYSNTLFFNESLRERETNLYMHYSK